MTLTETRQQQQQQLTENFLCKRHLIQRCVLFHMADISSAKYSLSNISHLSDDLLAEIFTRLPFRSIAGCKCVSKRWLDLMSSPYFIKLFISHHHNLFQALLMFLSPHELMLAFLPNPLEESCFISNPTPDWGFNSQTRQPLLSPDMLIKGNVCGCSNGLLLCCNNRYTTGDGFYVYNPFTKVCIQIAPSPAKNKENLYAVGFVCDPYYHVGDTTESMITPNSGYRVVIIRSFIRRVYEFEVEVFSSETGTWKKTIVICPEGFAFAPHWLLSYAYEGSLYFMGRTSIFVFDPYNHQSETLDYPADADSMNIMSFGFLGSSCGNLRIADIGLNDLRVWELIDPDHWHLLHRTDLSTKLPLKFCANYYKRVGGFHPYDGDIVYLHSYADGVFVANVRTNEFEAIPGYEKSDISPFQLDLP